MKKFNSIGLMSGTSLDGLDIAHCQFLLENNQWSFQLLETKTVSYGAKLSAKLKNCIHFSEKELEDFDKELGYFFGKKTKEFIIENNISPLLIASHGHTVFHQPDKGITLQIGNGLAIKNEVKHTVINDFRSLDVELGGQGAPLVPIGDKKLFSEYDYCLNLGGIANISSEKEGVRKAFDICSCNLVLNYFSEKLGFSYDDKGSIAQSGNFNSKLYSKLLENPYYAIKGAKSLGKEDVWGFDIDLLEKYDCPIEDKLRTFVEVIAFQISNSIQTGKLFITGGGVYNSFLIERIQSLNSNIEMIIPEKNIIEFKEALIFAFLGVLKHLEKINVLSSVTGASRDSSSGVIW